MSNYLVDNEETIRLYELREKSIHDEVTRIQGAREEGIKEGIKKGIFLTAKKMILAGIDINIIQDITGFNIEELEKIKGKLY